ncbi:leucyl aminopeptidase [Paenibacillus sp. HJL G12]|uniref:Probable cytosol aminopeptidase n=1 Tax=Paenibacillus dendrobii TaxID=2691084 RepID=A0A7X3IIL8_9BACL|nr:leucyl aminopeptidase [Paenibacillus dendrobii]MWV44203.1 leucyl aminopeptidase [Paenibacillus dendrobii]
MKGHSDSGSIQVSIDWKENLDAAQYDVDAFIVLVSPQGIQDGSMRQVWTSLLLPLMESHLFQAAPFQTYAVPLPGRGEYRTVIFVGAGERPLTSEELRIASAQAARMALKMRAKKLAWELSSPLVTFTAEQHARIAAQAMTEGMILGSYRHKQYKKSNSEYKGLEQLTFLRKGKVSGVEMADWEEGIARGRAFAESTCIARDLTNLPGNFLVPEDLARAAVEVAEKHGLESTVLDEKQLAAMGMGGLIAVGQGSVHPPRLIMIKYQGKDDWEDVIGLIGKGITFDTGGISLKRRVGMEEMISDMGGAAAVLGVMNALGRLRPAVNVVMVIPAAENMPAGNAFKPGDIIQSYSGRTIEVLNTDAEGRVVLADGMAYAREQGAAKLIDVATLTGAVLSALGDVATGVVTNDDTMLEEFILASKRTGEKVWPLPAYKEFWDMLKSDVADLSNSTGSRGAAITAGLFIGTFAEGLPWIHLDIAGTAFLNKERGVNPKGATGVMVRTLTEWILAQEAPDQ